MAPLSRNMMLESKAVFDAHSRCLPSGPRTVSAVTGSSRGPIELTFLGTSSASPTETRNVSSLLLKPGSETGSWMFDCGDGTLRQWNRRPGALSSLSTKLEAIFITHCHGDHVYGLPSLLMSLLSSSPSLTGDASSLYTAEQPLLIIGPLGLYRLLAPMIGSQSRVRVLECSPTVVVAGGGHGGSAHCAAESTGRASVLYPIGSASDASLRFEVYENADWKVLAVPIAHSILTLGYIVMEKRVAQGRKVVILGDTCDAYATLPLAANADCLVHECTFLNEHADQAHRTKHSTAQMVGAFASAAQPKTLLLNHLSPWYFKDEYHPKAKGLMGRLLEQVKASFRPCSGDVMLAHDFMTHVIHPRVAEPTLHDAASANKEDGGECGHRSESQAAPPLKDVVSSQDAVARLAPWLSPTLSLSAMRRVFNVEPGHENVILSMKDARMGDGEVLSR